YSLTSVAAFRETAERTKELGFTDLVVHWPRPEPPFAGDHAVLDELAGGVLDEDRAERFAGSRDGRQPALHRRHEFKPESVARAALRATSPGILQDRLMRRYSRTGDIVS